MIPLPLAPAPPSGAPPAFHLLAKAQRLGLQPGLRLLLLPGQGSPVPRQQVPHERFDAGAVHPPDHRGAPDGCRQHRLAGRRADADGPGLLPPGDGAVREIPPARHVLPAHHADQRHAAGRRVGGLLQGEQLPDRHQPRRAAPAARCLPRRQGRAGPPSTR